MTLDTAEIYTFVIRTGREVTLPAAPEIDVFDKSKDDFSPEGHFIKAFKVSAYSSG